MTEENSRAAEEEEKFNIILTTAPLIGKTPRSLHA